MHYILSIDQGTTGSKVVAYDKNGTIKAGSYQEFPQYFPKQGWVEHDPEEIWQSVYRCLQQVSRKLPKNSIAAIGITNQRETTVIWDRDTGKPIHNAIVWQCRRTAERCRQLNRDTSTRDHFRKKTGLPIDAYFSATKVEWLLKHIPAAIPHARKGKLAFGTMDTWVLHKLTGGRVHATDYTNASRTMLFDIGELHWDQDILKEFSIPPNMLPEVKRSSGVFGETIRIAGLPSGTPVAGIAGDQQAALFGQACFAAGTLKNTYGTGAFLLLNTGKKKILSRCGLITTLGCAQDGSPIYCLEGAIFIAGAVIQWLRDGLKVIDSAQQSQQLAESVTDNGGVYFVPALVGLGAPYWDPQARGAIYGITRGTQRAHIVRAALESLCYQTRDVLEAMQKDSGLKIADLKVDGGAVANDFLCQFQADMLGIKIIRPKAIETTSLGAAYLAGLAVGYWKNAAQIKKCWKADKIFTPRVSAEQADSLYKGWQKAVKRTLS